MNLDYLAIQGVSRGVLKSKLRAAEISADIEQLRKYESTRNRLQGFAWTDDDSASLAYRRYKEKRSQIGLFVKLLLKLRERAINPVLLVHDKAHLREMLTELRKGEVKTRGTIDRAILKDLKQEILSRKAVDVHYARETSFWKMVAKYFELAQYMVVTNMDVVAYLSMLIVAALNPGVLTLMYPFAVFGFALLEETSPPKTFWHLMMLYT